ncbi:MAG: hypothetical protein JO037_04175 [Actinobacteria bacterium]|nr:hypothetical protein [Actinomycetota bacterium]
MAGGAAALVLAGTPAMANSQAITGPETAYGAVYGKPATANNPVIPLTWRGLVNAHGVFSPTGPGPKKGQRHTFTTSAGNLTVVVTAKPTNSQSFDPKACHFSFTTYVVFAVLGGKSTGKFAGTSGPGAVQVYFAGYGPRYTSGPHKGQCNPNAPELAKGAVASFLLSAVLTT